MATKPYTKEREEDFVKYLKESDGISYAKKALGWFKRNLNEIITANELALITGKSGKPINHNVRRVFELRDEAGYEIINHKDNDSSGKNLRVDEWILLSETPNPKKIRNRGVNKRIMYEVFERDNFQCQVCGRTPHDDDPFATGKKIKLHVGHIVAHKQKEDGTYLKIEKMDDMIEEHLLTKKDFITMCNVCNEGAKNNDLKLMSNLDKIKLLPEKEQKEILKYLNTKFK